MACAKKCDRCGKLYEQYNSKNDRKNPNGIMVLNLDSQRRYFTHNALDLCPDCMKGFQDWFGEVKQMERLTLENAINRSRKLAERHRWNSENTKLETSDENANEVYKNTCIQYADQEEQYAEWLEELKSYKDIGTPKELKETVRLLEWNLLNQQ